MKASTRAARNAWLWFFVVFDWGLVLPWLVYETWKFYVLAQKVSALKKRRVMSTVSLVVITVAVVGLLLPLLMAYQLSLYGLSEDKLQSWLQLIGKDLFVFAYTCSRFLFVFILLFKSWMVYFDIKWQLIFQSATWQRLINQRTFVAVSAARKNQNATTQSAAFQRSARRQQRLSWRRKLQSKSKTKKDKSQQKVQLSASGSHTPLETDEEKEKDYAIENGDYMQSADCCTRAEECCYCFEDYLESNALARKWARSQLLSDDWFVQNKNKGFGSYHVAKRWMLSICFLFIVLYTTMYTVTKYKFNKDANRRRHDEDDDDSGHSAKYGHSDAETNMYMFVDMALMLVPISGIALIRLSTPFFNDNFKLRKEMKIITRICLVALLLFVAINVPWFWKQVSVTTYVVCVAWLHQVLPLICLVTTAWVRNRPGLVPLHVSAHCVCLRYASLKSRRNAHAQNWKHDLFEIEMDTYDDNCDLDDDIPKPVELRAYPKDCCDAINRLMCVPLVRSRKSLDGPMDVILPGERSPTPVALVTTPKMQTPVLSLSVADVFNTNALRAATATRECHEHCPCPTRLVCYSIFKSDVDQFGIPIAISELNRHTFIQSKSTGSVVDDARDRKLVADCIRLNTLLMNEIGFDIFMHHLFKEFSSENLIGLVELFQFHKLCGGTALPCRLLITDFPAIVPTSEIVANFDLTKQQKAAALCEKYILSNSKYMVNISSRTRQRLEEHYGVDKLQSLEHKTLRDMFVSPALELFRLMQDSFGRFIATEDFAKFTAKVKKGAIELKIVDL